MRSQQEIQDKLIELQIQLNKKNKKYLEAQIDILNWVLEGNEEISLDELQKDGFNIEFG